MSDTQGVSMPEVQMSKCQALGTQDCFVLLFHPSNLTQPDSLDFKSGFFHFSLGNMKISKYWSVLNLRPLIVKGDWHYCLWHLFMRIRGYLKSTDAWPHYFDMTCQFLILKKANLRPYFCMALYSSFFAGPLYLLILIREWQQGAGFPRDLVSVM